ncbi:Putative uncharacterized protein [Taphrina deformans PYCC 5710]|uniref:Peptide hydrolase n=1 Tax=Taphrina deformans (strain PYCC 5710 / ATCC 11124 / CBS 356.35 / IMI 108563 / JCM 9778 / NBRC 8474) TaxID=1097556 RepID=R4X6V3_TAPDE|nr:Putative uncharacterized protein [Taphrina deformans PYCC 5710]|eukprot:CCG80946.1 Putative uncharacterized protein [Taphrina deformans PYCC 5710]
MMVPLSTLLTLLPLCAAVFDTHTSSTNDAALSAAHRADEQGILQLAQSNLRLIQTSDTKEPRWALEEDKDALRRMGIRFMDITDHQDLGKMNAALAVTAKKDETHKKDPFPKKLKHTEFAKKFLKSLDKTSMHTHLSLLTAFHSRYYKSSYGAASGEFLFNLVQNISSVHEEAITVKQFKHPWGQHSIIARIQGSESNDTVVIGAHQDSANLFLPTILAAPGADDDGSGTVTILEVLRVLAAGQFVPKNSLEFHWYSAEEGGLLGSQAVFEAYEKKGANVTAMLQQDMTGYISKTIDAGGPEALGVITDFVDQDLTRFIKTVIGGYCSLPYVETQCGYACSDHASASRAGYRSAFVIESEFKYSNPAIHSQNDLIEHLSFHHMLEHAKLTTGFAIELGLAGKKDTKDKNARSGRFGL